MGLRERGLGTKNRPGLITRAGWCFYSALFWKLSKLTQKAELAFHLVEEVGHAGLLVSSGVAVEHALGYSLVQLAGSHA